MSYDFVKIAGELPGAEGPVVHPDGRFFMVVPPEGRIVQVSKDGEVRDFANTGGIPAGLQVDKEGHLWCADMGLGILRIAPDGAVTHVVDRYDGAPIRGCNDCIFDTSGNLYFTAPAGSSADNPIGEIFCRTAAGAVHRLDQGFAFCNGIAVSADDRFLFVAETHTKSVWRYVIVEPGRVGEKELWAKLPGDHKGGPDGMDFDEAGLLLATNWGGSSIDVFDSGGKLVERITTPFHAPSNVHFGGPDRRRVYVTEHENDALWQFTWVRAGQPQFCDL